MSPVRECGYRGVDPVCVGCLAGVTDDSASPSGRICVYQSRVMMGIQ